MGLIETHTDGTFWRACTKERPTKAAKVGDVNIYHPDARVLTESESGADSKYGCPHCGLLWWVEYDG